MSQMIRYRILIIGIDFPIIHTYLRNAAQSSSNDIQGFVYCGDGDPPVPLIKGTTKIPIRVIPLKYLEEAITKYRITKCQFLAQNIPMNRAKSIINRITACNCMFEFLRPKDISIRCHKPIIIISALASSIGKTQVCRHFCFALADADLQVSVIFPISEILNQTNEAIRSRGLDESDGLHYEFKDVSEIPENIFSDDDLWQIKEYLSCRISRVFATTDVRKAVIAAEQLTDIIIVDSRKCEISFIESEYRLCIISKESFSKVKENCLWPGLVNLNMANDIILVANEKTVLPPEYIEYCKKILEGKTFFSVKSDYVLDNFDGRDLFERPTVVVEHEDTKGHALRAVNSFLPAYVSSKSVSNTALDDDDAPDDGISFDSRSLDFDDDSDDDGISPLLRDGLPEKNENLKPTIIVKTPRAASPLQDGIIEQTHKKMKILTDAINATEAEYVVVTLQRDVEGLQPGKKVIYANPEIVAGEDLQRWFANFLEINRKPPLLEHFAAQVDIIMAMAQASDNELYVSNNGSANRESFCRLFLSTHIPPGFRVTTGEIIDSSSNTTGQLDVVVVNDRCPRLTIDSTNSIVAPILADNVLCVIEVKTSLTSDQLKKALSQMRPVKALMPTHSTLTQPNGKIIPDPLDGKIITGIFSFNKGDTIEDEIEGIVELFPGVVDFIVIPDSFGYFWVETLKVCGLMDKSAPYPPNSYVKKSAKGMGLAFMFGILNSLAAIRRFSGSYLLRYINGCWGAQEEQLAKNVQNLNSYVTNLNKISSNSISKEKKKEIHKGHTNLLNAFSALYKLNPIRYSYAKSKYNHMKKAKDNKDKDKDKDKDKI